jgi:hypothetical protein
MRKAIAACQHRSARSEWTFAFGRRWVPLALSAEPFYRAMGFELIDPIDRELNGHPVPEARMAKTMSKLRPEDG